MPQLTLSLFGIPAVELDGVSVRFATRKATAILIYLAVTKQPQGRDGLMLLLWPEADTRRARASLRRALADIKKVIGGGWITVEADTLCLNEQANIGVDVWEFRSLLTAVSPQQKAAYTQAAQLYRADFLAGFGLRDSPAFDEWQFFEQEDLRQLLMETLEALISWHHEAEELDQAIFYARRCVTLDALHEPAHVQLMRLYAENGQQTAALRQYEECQRILADELGVDPDTATTTLYHQIKSHRFHLLTLSPLNLPYSHTDTSSHNLPTPTTSFIGRQEELAQIVVMLDNPKLRLLTFVGLGGVGKTRLALEVANRQMGRFADGVWYIALDSLQSAQAIITAVADSLKLVLRGSDDPQQQLMRYVQGKEMLLLFDNFEHLVHGASLISEILHQSPNLKIIVTSREMLDLAEEWLYQVEGLPFPSNNDQSAAAGALALQPASANRFAAVQLFVKRALQTRHDFLLAENEACIAVICQLVEGLPLALELSAAWVRMLSCQQIVMEIQRNLDFLATTRRNVTDRHRSVRAVFEASWQMLSAPEQTLLAELSVFRADFGKDAALAITGFSLFTLYGLLNKSLLQAVRNGRYKLHKLLQQFAAEKLLNSTEVHERHSAYYNDLLQQHQNNLSGGQQTVALETIRQDMENCYQAWLWAAENGRIKDLNQSFHTLYHYHAMRSLYQQGEHIFGQTINLLEPYLGVTDQETITLLARLTVYRGEYLYTIGKMTQAENALRSALSFTQQMHLENEHELAIQTLGVITYLQGRYAEARALLHQALELVIRLDAPDRQAYILMTLGAIEQALGNYDNAENYHRTCLSMFADLHYQWGVANTLRFLGVMAYRQGDYLQAHTCHQQSLEICQMLGFETGVAMAFNNLGLVAEAKGHVEEAYRLFEKALVSSQESHSGWTQAVSLQNMGRVLIGWQQTEKGQKHLYEALETAVKAEATPLALEIILDLASQLEAKEQKSKAATLVALVAQHPASQRETQLKANHMQARLPSPITLLLGEQSIKTLQEQVSGVLSPLG